MNADKTGIPSGTVKRLGLLNDPRGTNLYGESAGVVADLDAAFCGKQKGHGCTRMNADRIGFIRVHPCASVAKTFHSCQI
jgi:hypothetical protein